MEPMKWSCLFFKGNMSEFVLGATFCLKACPSICLKDCTEPYASAGHNLCLLTGNFLERLACCCRVLPLLCNLQKLHILFHSGMRQAGVDSLCAAVAHLPALQVMAIRVAPASPKTA
jgi:hypothetical protein